MNKHKIILDLCGGTGSWSMPYSVAGYDVRIIDPIYKWFDESCTVEDFKPPENVYGILAAPPCTMFSFVRTNAKSKRDLDNAMKTVYFCLSIIWECQKGIKNENQKLAPLKFWALENPNKGMLKWFLGKPAFTFNPYDFGDNYKKETALWGIFNEPVKNPIECNTVKFDRMASKDIHSEFYGRFDRQRRRSMTPQGFANAFFKENQ